MLHWASAQNPFPSRLSALDDEELLEIFNEFSGDSIAQEQIARTYLDRARRAKDTIKMARGYDRLARIFHHEKNLAFADSIIALTEHLHHKTYPALGYIIKGFEYGYEGEVVPSTHNLVKAYDITKQTGNLSLQVSILHVLVEYKSTWGNPSEALILQRKRDSIVESRNFLDELKKSSRKSLETDYNNLLIREKIFSNESFIICFQKLQLYDSVVSRIDKLQQLTSLYSGVEKPYFEVWSKFQFAKASLLVGDNANVLEYLEDLRTKDSNLFDARSWFDYYNLLGRAYLNLDSTKVGARLLILADSIYSSSKIHYDPFDRNVQKSLLTYYKKNEDKNKQIEFLTKLIVIDSVFKKYYKYYDTYYINEIETPELIADKEELIIELTEVNKASKNFSKFLLVILFILLLILIYYFRQRNIYKYRFSEILSKTGHDIKAESLVYKNDISNEVINDLIEKLNVFEESKGYLKLNISLNSLSKEFKTNSNYLSRVVNLKKEKNFSQYLHDLRIEYATESLIKDSLFRKYTIKAVAEECGYSSAESFSKAFYRKHGIYPSYFVKKLNKPKL